MANVNFGDYESRNWFDRKLRQSGLFDKLEAMGIQDGDIVSLYDLEFQVVGPLAEVAVQNGHQVALPLPWSFPRAWGRWRRCWRPRPGTRSR